MHGCCSINHLTRWSCTPRLKRAGQFDAEQPFPVIRHRTSLMLPEPDGAEQGAGTLRRECDRLLFGAAALLGLLAPRLRSRGWARSSRSPTAMKPPGPAPRVPGRVMRLIGDSVDTVTYPASTPVRGSPRPSATGSSPDAPTGARVDAQTFHPRVQARVRGRVSAFGLSTRPVVVCVSRLMPRKARTR